MICHLDVCQLYTLCHVCRHPCHDGHGIHDKKVVCRKHKMAGWLKIAAQKQAGLGCVGHNIVPNTAKSSLFLCSKLLNQPSISCFLRTTFLS